MSLSPKNSAPNSLDATMEALAVQQSEAVDTADPPRLAPSNQSLLGPPSALHIDTNEPEDVEVAHSRLMMRLSSGGKRAVGGVFACSLSLVNDGSESRLWAQSYFRFLAQTCFDLSPSAVEGLLPVVQSERSRSPATTNSATASLDEMPIDSGPFVALIETELSHDEIVQLFCYVLWRTTHAVGYDARTRAMFRIACRQFHNISWTVIGAEEVVLARALLLEATELQSTKKVQSPRKWTDWRRNLAIGGAAVAGGTLLALTGGLATPLVAAGFSALGGAGAVIGTALASSGAVTAATVLFGTAGAGLAGYKTDRRTLGIKQFEFQLLTPGDGMHVYVCVAGWLEEDNAADFSNAFGTPREYLRAFYAQFCPEKLGLVDSMLERYKGREDELFAMLRKQYNLPLDQDPVTVRLEQVLPTDGKPYTEPSPVQLRAWQWKHRMPFGDQYSLCWEKDVLVRFGKNMRTFTREMILSYARGEIIQRTIFAALFAAVALPKFVINLCNMIDSEWAMVMARADTCGVLLAKTLMARQQGLRPVSLVGYGMGGRLIFSCLKHLAGQGVREIV
ncbi:hypothetical protein, variant 2 [Aphanomyces invadans]|uniref:Uncharacterized protein n=1 Tax=Aphanomyces invadans TaxID=157072 RepID=A0A024TWM6_9STRA|nr:hypothetical protein, variant 2 [Aphanomyces invadans]ETV98379.1 hypothetical protein, variant 2 [Aphanomyces invadans]|eukprot:XP_008873254.1 hypothetical protein, variant 2 [Aphanomyces invadans]